VFVWESEQCCVDTLMYLNFRLVSDRIFSSRYSRMKWREQRLLLVPIYFHLIYSLMYDMMWCYMIRYDIWCDVLWYMILYMIWWYDMIYDIMWYDVMRCDMIYDTIYDIILYIINYNNNIIYHSMFRLRTVLIINEKSSCNNQNSTIFL
jgi:hypothetical protein